MSMELSLELRQVQRLSPQMIQSMEILQMSTQELQAYVEKLLLENPVLEAAPPHREEAGDLLRRKVEWLSAHDRQNRQYHREDARDLMANLAGPEGESLYDHLWGQLDSARMGAELRRAVDCVLTGLDGNGYLEESTEQLAARCGLPEELVARAEELVRGLEPAGVGARSLSQCLAIQLERRGERGLPLTIVRDHLEEMAKNHYNQIARQTGAGREEIQGACRVIRTLNPRPGGAFSRGESPGYLIPDLVVVEEEGRLVVRPAQDSVAPQLKMSAYYQQLMRDTDETQVRDYLTEKVRQACWVVRGIEQRQSTLLSCARSIVGRQEDFFRCSRGELSPMTLADVAQELGIHESTVSRAVKGKYLQCARGVYPLGYFFSRALPAAGGEGVSPQKAKAAIRALIDGEDKAHPLSDQKLCQLLAQREMLLSRRTVAKYRDEMGIPSTAGRKEF